MQAFRECQVGQRGVVGSMETEEGGHDSHSRPGDLSQPQLEVIRNHLLPLLVTLKSAAAWLVTSLNPLFLAGVT